MSHERRIQQDGMLRDLLVAELRHRLRNLLTLVQYFIAKTQSGTVGEYRDALIARIHNLAAGYELIEQREEDPVLLADLLDSTLRTYAKIFGNQIHASGPDIQLERGPGLALHLAFHELVTNACKHGALTSPSGRIDILWELDGDASKLLIQWSERGGPEVHEPQHRGFGINLLKKVLGEGMIDMQFNPSGLVCRFFVSDLSVS